jgi:tryptophan synthase alpha chain
LEKGATVQRCLDFAGDVARAFDIPFLLMTYYNIPFTYGVDAFVEAMAEGNIRGAILPDLPPEEGLAYRNAMRRKGLSPVHLFSPTSSGTRMRTIASLAGGFIYCVARKGVTGRDTAFSADVGGYLERCREATSLPLAMGFGVKGGEDVGFLKGKADIAVVGSETIRRMEEGGIAAVGEFVRGLR